MLERITQSLVLCSIIYSDSFFVASKLFLALVKISSETRILF